MRSFYGFFVISLLSVTKLLDAEERPNFILILADDMGYSDFVIYKDERLKTPNIDLLSKSGQVWTNFYASSAVCTPSRAGLLTGRLPVRSGLYGLSLIHI